MTILEAMKADARKCNAAANWDVRPVGRLEKAGEYSDFLRANPGSTVNEVAAHFGILSATANAHLRKMYDHGMVTRRRKRMPSGMKANTYFLREPTNG